MTLLAIGGLVAVAVLRLASAGELDADHWTPFTTWTVWRYLLQGLQGTVQSALIVAVLAAPLGLVLGISRSSRRPVPRWIATVWVEIARTVPLLLLIYLMLFGLPQMGINLPVLWKMVLPLTFTTSAVLAEILRAGIASLPRGQAEAAYSLGLSRSRTMRHVILPQALRTIAPALLPQFVSLLKDTTLGYILAYTELLYRAQILTSHLIYLVPTYLVTAAMYLTVSGTLTWLGTRVHATTVPRSKERSAPSQTAAT